MGRLRILFLAVLLTGCCVRPSCTVPQIVTRVEVIHAAEEGLEHFTYTSPEKIEILLGYLRTARPSAADPITPETFRAEAYEIRVTLLDGTQRVYNQIYDRYLQRPGDPWRHIHTSHGGSLRSLLQELPPDL